MARKSLLSIGLALALTGALQGCQSENTTAATAQVETNMAAHWLSPEWVVIKANIDANKFNLTSTDQAGSTTTVELKAAKLPKALLDKYPHLVDFKSLKLNGDFPTKDALKGKVTVKQYSGNTLITESVIQNYGVIDALYTSAQNDANEIMNYGATLVDEGVNFTLWSPTATNVSVQLFDEQLQPTKLLPMAEDKQTGVWQLTTSESKHLGFYKYVVNVYHHVSDKFESLYVTDPYSLSLSTNSLHSQVIDLSSSNTMPSGWNEHAVPTVESPEDLALYEMHIRDFSASDKNLSSEQSRGKYQAFSETNSDGIKHLKMLRDAGLNTLHFLPTYDISTVNEDPAQAIDINDKVQKICTFHPELDYCADESLRELTLDQLLSKFDPRGGEAQALMETIRNSDNYNWGYDPYHYTVPEGGYAVQPNAEARVIEFREMVKSVHDMGFRLIMDVVYNHTFQAGLGDKSVLDKVVPGYYHRLNPVSGLVEQSTCCDNSATEHAMMEKLMTDSLVVWARDYKIDGFRFDLMGHQPKDAMLRSRDAVEAVDPDTYFYGEGWNFGEVANNAQFVQASQNELAGTEIGTFTDRLRDAIRGGNFQTGREGLRRDQGIGNGLYVIPNDLQPEDNQYGEYLESMDQVRVGLAGNLKTYSIVDINNQTKKGGEVNYGGSPAGYALDPADTVNYVSKHDNQSLWDNNQYRLPYNMSSDDRVRVQSLSLAYPLLSQGIPFLHMGSELLRSKGFLRDSYDYGDWYNKVDFGYQSNNYDIGLPPAVKDEDNWPVISKLLKENGNNDDVSPAQIERSAKVFADFISIRMSSKLFRMTTASQIEDKLTFHNMGSDHIPGLIVMELNDNVAPKLDDNYESIVVLFNNDDESKTFAFNAAGYQLHPAQQNGTDKVVKTAKATANSFKVPALSAVVFVK